MPDTPTLAPAQQLAATNKAHFPNERGVLPSAQCTPR